MPATSMTSTPKPTSPGKAGLTTTRTAMTPASATSTKNTRTKNTRTERTRLLPTPAEHTRSGGETDFIHSGIAVPESIHADAAVMQLQHNAVQLLGGGRAARSRKPDSGPAGTISITVPMCRTRWNGMKPLIQCVLTPWIPVSLRPAPGFTASGGRATVLVEPVHDAFYVAADAAGPLE